MLKRNLIFMILLLLVGSMSANLLFEENFTGTPGNTLTTYGWTAHSGSGSNPGQIGTENLTYTGYTPASGYSAETVFTGTTSAEDVHKSFGAQTSGTVYVSLLVKVPTTTNASSDYFFHLAPETIGTDFKGRIFWKKDPAGSNIAFGLAKAGNAAAAAYTGFNYQFDTTYLIVMRYDIITGTANDVVSLWINPATGSEPAADLSAPDVAGNDIGNVGSVAIRQGNPTSPIKIDGIRVGTTWTDLFGSTGNIPPSITSIVQTPSIDIQATTTVSVSADVTDSDGTVSLVQCKWGTATGTYPNTINMAVGTAPTYTTVSNILAQPAGTTVYYVVYAVDDDTDSSTSAEHSYTVIAPATTTIPYTEDFSAGWGDTYMYDVAGTHPWYVYNSDNASCNGYGGTLEEHWLVLPAINFNNYTQERMTFNTIATFGVIDANNYLNLMYSSNYFGLGDPSSATWTPIPFTNGGVGGGETPSGVLDLSGISGTNVYLAFKYYSTDNPSRWELDDINIYIASVPVITAAPATLTGFTYEGTGPSAAQTFTVSGADLTADIVLTAPTNYEISLSETSGYVSPLTLTQTGGTVAATTIYARLKSGLAVGEYNNEVINITSTGADPQTVTCSGEVTAPPPPDAPVALDATNVGGTSFTANWSAVTGATGYYLDVYTVGGAAATDLIISEYLEGSSSNKYIEVFNGTGTEVDLSDYKLQLFSNGSATVTTEVSLTGTLANGASIVYKNSASTLTLPAGVTAIDNSAVNHNGDDAVALYKISTLSFVDIFGRIGDDPGSAWTGDGDYTTVNKTLVRIPSVTAGITVSPTGTGPTAFTTLTTEWNMYDVDTTDYLGSHLMGTINYVTGYQNLDVGNVTTYPVTGLTAGTTYYYVVRAYNSNGTSDNSNPISVTVGAEIALTVINEAELINIPGYPSDEYSTYQVVGNYLSAPITVTAPEHFEVSTATDTGYAPSIELVYNFSGNIYVRINSSVVGEHSGVLTLSSDGAMDATAQLTGETIDPPVTWNITENLTAFSHEVGTPSAYQSYTLSATGAYSSSTLDLTVDGPFEISSSASGPWSATLELAYNFNGSVYVRMNSSVAGNFTGSILHETTDASPATIDLEGTATPPAGNFASELFFSEYIEGSSNNKAIEIFNGTGAAVDLSNYSVKLYANGVTSPPTSTYTAPTGTTLAHGEVWVIANASANAEILAIADITHGVANYNGDDALELINNGTAATIDIFGCIGEDPGTEWGTEPEWTINKTMVRNCAVTGGVTVNPASGFPTITTEWTFYDIDTISYLGSHVFCPGGGDLDTPVVQIIQAGGTITLSWDAITSATYYEIWSASDPYGTYTLAEANWTGTTWSETSAVMKFYKVIAKN